MNTMPPPAEMAQSGSHGVTRFNALRHGVLSRYTVLPWEDEGEYRALVDALVAEHAPEGPTEEHLVEELAGIIWRKRRLRMPEAAVYRERLRHDSTAHNSPEHIAGAALLPVTGKANGKASIDPATPRGPLAYVVGGGSICTKSGEAIGQPRTSRRWNNPSGNAWPPAWAF